jgi:hypothetical protein
VDLAGSKRSNSRYRFTIEVKAQILYIILARVFRGEGGNQAGHGIVGDQAENLIEGLASVAGIKLCKVNPVTNGDPSI